MNEDRIKILKMLEEGKLTADEAATLLQAISSEETAPGSPIARPAPRPKARAKGASQFKLGEWLKQLLGMIAKASHVETLEQTHDAVGIQQVAIETVNGAIEYVGSAQSQFTVHAEKVVKAPEWAAAEAFARQVQIHVTPAEDNKLLRIYAEHPKPPRHVEVIVSFTVQGPQRIQVKGRSTNGTVHINQVEGEVQARSTNGEVRLQGVTGQIQAAATNGNVKGETLKLHQSSEFSSQNGEITLSIEAGQAPITATTANGSVRLTLPADYAGQVDARTQNGRVRTDFQTQMTQRSQNWLVGPIGAGGETLLKLRSQNGNVTVAMANG